MPVRPKTQPTPPPSPFVDTDGAASFLLAAPQTLANMRLTGEGPPFSKFGGKVLYHVDDLLEFVAERKVKSTSEVEYSGRPVVAHQRPMFSPASIVMVTPIWPRSYAPANCRSPPRRLKPDIVTSPRPRRHARPHFH
jgi:hypothetical protein